MINYRRIIAKLDIKNSDLVKGVNFEGLRVMGNPHKYAEEYYNDGADELFYQDVVASLYNRNGLFDIINRTSKNIFIPLTVAGGLRNIEDMKKALNIGADKVCINTAALKNPDLINEAARVFGSSTIVVSIETSNRNLDDFYVYANYGRELMKKKALDWAKEVSERGAGEIIISSIDRDGTFKGYNLELIKKISKIIKIPLIAHGGAGKIDDFFELFKIKEVSAASVSSLLHYAKISNINNNKKEIQGNITYLTNNISKNKKIGNTLTIKKIKKELKKKVNIIYNY
jgi:cyclase